MDKIHKLQKKAIRIVSNSEYKVYFSRNITLYNIYSLELGTCISITIISFQKLLSRPIVNTKHDNIEYTLPELRTSFTKKA